MELPKAIEFIESHTPTIKDTESVPVAGARGRVVATSVTAPIDLPPFDCSAMDGYALSTSSLTGTLPYRLVIVGNSLAGHPYQGRIGPGECVRITTGAVVPVDANAVVIQENCERSGNELRIRVTVDAGEHIREAGNDVRRGKLIAPAGRMLNGFDIGWFAACGIPTVEVTRPVRVALFSTGDELQETGSALRPGGIYDANRMVLLQLLESLPVVVEDLGILADEPQILRQALSAAALRSDLILTSGGVSVGDADQVKNIVEEIGRIEFWRLNMKPGKPLAYGEIGDAMFLGLPGNPVSAIVTFLLIAQPLIRALAGAESRPTLNYAARLSTDLMHQPGREEYQRGQLRMAGGDMEVQVGGDQGSNRLGSFSNADCLIRVPAESGDLPTGTWVEVLPFFGIASGT